MGEGWSRSLRPAVWGCFPLTRRFRCLKQERQPLNSGGAMFTKKAAGPILLGLLLTFATGAGAQECGNAGRLTIVRLIESKRPGAAARARDGTHVGCKRDRAVAANLLVGTP